MEGFLILDPPNAAAIGCNYKADEAAWPCPQIMARRKLADISNLPQKGRPLIQEQKSQSIPVTTKEYIEQLQKENLALAKMLAHRNKIIEQSGIELERLRLNLIKMREQNQQLALSHTLMLAELNSGKDRLKALQHELGCKSSLLQARNSKLEVNMIKEDESLKEGEDHKKPCKGKRKLRSHSLGSSEQLQSEDNAENRPPMRRQSTRFKAVKPDGDSLSETDDSKFRKCLPPDGTAPSTSVDASAKNEDHVANRPSSRRQSARFKSVTPCPLPDEIIQANGSTFVETLVKNEGHAVQRPSARRQSTRFKVNRPKQADDLLEMDDTVSPKCSSLDEPVQENGSTSVETSVKNEDDRSCSGRGCESQVSRKPSLGRPSRAAARKVQSYKEIPLSVKMRRSE